MQQTSGVPTSWYEMSALKYISAISCIVPGAPSHGSVSPAPGSRVTTRGRITYTCNEGYAISRYGSIELTATCEEDRRWNVDAPVCEGDVY